MAVAKNPSGQEVCLLVDANGSLLTFAGTMLATGEVMPSGLMFGEMRMFGVDPGTPWVKADGKHVTARGKSQALPDLRHHYVYLPA